MMMFLPGQFKIKVKVKVVSQIYLCILVFAATPVTQPISKQKGENIFLTEYSHVMQYA